MNTVSNLKYKESDVIKSHEWLLVCRLPEEGNKTNDMDETFRIMKGLGYKATAYLLCNVPWFYVNLNDKLFFSGKIGIDLLSGKECIGKHAITFREFLEIHSIFQKYEQKSILEFK